MENILNIKEKKGIGKKGELREFFVDNWALVVSGSILFIVLVYIFIMQDNIYIQTHDNLDSNVAWLRVLKAQKLFFAHNTSVPVLNGLSRDYFDSEWKLYTWLYMIFPTFAAYIIGWFLKVILSTVSFSLLAKEFLDKKYHNIILLCGFLYGLMPTFPTAAIAFGSAPLFFFVVCRLYRSSKPIKWFVCLFFYPVLSNFVSFGIFYCGLLLLFIIFDIFITRRWKWRLFWGLCLLSLGFILTEYRLFNIFLFAKENTIRDSIEVYTTLGQSVRGTLQYFRNGQYHAGTLQRYVIFPVCCLYFIYNNMQYIERNLKSAFKDPFNYLMLFQFISSFFMGFAQYKPFNNIVWGIIPLLKGFNIGRIEWLNPFVLTCAFCLVLKNLFDKGYYKIYKFILLGALLVTFGKAEKYNDIYANLSINIKKLQGIDTNEYTYREFYAEKLFDKAKAEINYNGEKAVAFCIEPSVLAYNGISTLDGYISFLTQEYKDSFEKLIEPVMARDDEVRAYYSNWGGRAYVFPIGYFSFDIRKKLPIFESELYFNPIVFREMGGKYVFSRVRITNAEEMELALRGEYSVEEIPYKLYVYSIKE